MGRDEKSSGDTGREENSCDQPRRAEKGRRHQMGWEEMRFKKLRKHEMR